MKKSIKIIALLLVVCSMAFTVNFAANYNVQSAYAAVIKQGSTGATVKTIQQKTEKLGLLHGRG